MKYACYIFLLRVCELFTGFVLIKSTWIIQGGTSVAKRTANPKTIYFEGNKVKSIKMLHAGVILIPIGLAFLCWYVYKKRELELLKDMEVVYVYSPTNRPPRNGSMRPYGVASGGCPPSYEEIVREQSLVEYQAAQNAQRIGEALAENGTNQNGENPNGTSTETDNSTVAVVENSNQNSAMETENASEQSTQDTTTEAENTNELSSQNEVNEQTNPEWPENVEYEDVDTNNGQ